MTNWLGEFNSIAFGSSSGPTIVALRVALIAVAAWVAAMVLNRMIRDLCVRIARRLGDPEQVKRAETIGRVLRYITSVVIPLNTGGTLCNKLPRSRDQRSTSEEAQYVHTT